MVFNWFRRQFDDTPETPEGEKEQAIQADPEVDAAQPVAAQGDGDAMSEEDAQDAIAVEAATSEAKALEAAETVDYLSWAKAAYQNIQQQQVESEVAEVAEAAPVPETAASDKAPVTAESTVETMEQAEIESPAESEIEAVPEAAPSAEISSSSMVAETPIDETIETAASPEVLVEKGIEAAMPEARVEALPDPQVNDLTVESSTEKISAVDSAELTAGAIAPDPDRTAIEETSETLPETAIATRTTDPPDAGDPSSPDGISGSESTQNPPAADRTDADTTAKTPVPFWAAAEADRQARLERLKATAIETPAVPEATPVASAQPSETTSPPPTTTTPAIAFDEGFLWSAEVLAAQGRRPDDISVEEITWLKKLRQGLDKTRRNLINQLKSIVGQGPLNQDAVMEIEALLLQADVGVAATDRVIEALQDKLRQEVLPPEEAIAYLKTILRDMLDRPYSASNGKPADYTANFAPTKDSLNVWLMTGVNGAGKTTTIGKIAYLARKSDYRCLIAAADTFRAAAVEQVKIWGQRSGVEAIANPGQNTDPAAVVFDAIAAAKARNTELLLVDTAGRLQNKKNLMAELSKIRRIIDKKAPDATIESLLVLDATLGQNGLRQAEVFAEAAQLSGVVLTKLDGTAKGGVALAVVEQLGLPIRFIGAGEGIEDLRPFSSYEFVEALLNG